MAGHVSHTDLSALASHTPNTFGHHPQARKLATSETTIWRASGGWGSLPSSENTKLSLVSRSLWDTRDAANVKTALADITGLCNPGWPQAQTMDDESPQGDWPPPPHESQWKSPCFKNQEKGCSDTLSHFLSFHAYDLHFFLHFWQRFYFIVFFYFYSPS